MERMGTVCRDAALSRVDAEGTERLSAAGVLALTLSSMLTPKRTFPELPAPPATFKAKIPQWAGFRKMCFKVWEELTIPVYAKQPRYGDGMRGAYICPLKNPRVPFFIGLKRVPQFPMRRPRPL